ILKCYMQDTLNARLMGVPPTGNGRRESFAHVPMPRMTNTVMVNGDRDPAEIIASVDDGLYAVNFGGGQVDITNGKFVFSAAEAWKIENGKLVYPVKGATLIGNGPDALTRVSMIGNDMTLDAGIGTCGKEGQSVPVGVGHSTLKPAPRVFTQEDIDAAVLHTLETVQLPSTAAKAYEAIRPSVVRVVGLGPERQPAATGDPFERTGVSVGSGVVIVDKGMILTSLHVVAEAQQIKVQFFDGLESEAIIVGARPE